MTNADDLPATFLVVSSHRSSHAGHVPLPLPCLACSALRCAVHPVAPPDLPALHCAALPYPFLFLQGDFDELVGYEEECTVPEPLALPARP